MFEWDDGNLEHVARHGVSPQEAEQALQDPRRVSAPSQRTGAEHRRAAIGATEAGRLLFVVMTSRHRDMRIITARDANQTERRRYQARGK